MRNTHTVLRELESWVAAEITSKEALRALVDDQTRAVQMRSASALAEVTRAVEAQLAFSAEREALRTKLYREAANALSIGNTSPTLEEIAHAAADDGAVLCSLRDDLRRSTSALLRSTRRLAALARMHSQIVREAVELVAGSPRANGAGSLVCTEA